MGRAPFRPRTSSPGSRAAGTRSTPSGSRSRTRSPWRAPSSSRASRRRSSSIRGSSLLDRLFSEGGAHAQEGRRLLLQRPTGFELHSVRDYVHGDSLRKVHWRSTAQARAADGEGARGRAARRGGGAARRRRGARPLGDSFDVAVRAAGSILQAHHRRGRRCALVVNSAARETQADRDRCELAARARDPRRRGADRAHAGVSRFCRRTAGIAARSLELVVVTSRVDVTARRPARSACALAARRLARVRRDGSRPAAAAAPSPGGRDSRSPSCGAATISRPRSAHRRRALRRTALVALVPAVVIAATWLRLEDPRDDPDRVAARRAARARTGARPAAHRADRRARR